MSDSLVYASGFDTLYGLRVTEQSGERVRAELVADERHLQPFGLVHGGVYATIAETLASIGATLAAMQRKPGTGAVGLENHTSFIRAVGKGTRIVAEATPRHAGARVQLWTVTMRDAQDQRELAVSTVRLAVVDVPER